MKTNKLRQNYHRRGITPFRRKILCLIALFFFSSNIAFANPYGPQVINGNVSFKTQGNNLTITNSPNSIINWQGFSIGVNELTRFIQQSGNSAILNRVIGQDPSAILGALQSNGRVFLINPNGILFGQGARIDVNGLIASTLNLSNQDFLAGRYNFTAGIRAGSIENQGTITTPMGGQVYLIAPDIKNSGIINSPKGDVILAAGHSVQLVDSANPFIAVTVSAPENSVVNLGQIIADSGRIGIYGGLISQKGLVKADSAVSEGGKIFLKATKAIELADTSVISADGTKGGQIIVKTEENGQISGTLIGRGLLSAQGDGSKDSGGFIETSAAKVDLNGIRVKTKGGNWLIDPTDYTIAADDPLDGSSYMSNTTLSTNLADNSILIQTLPGGGGNGDIFVNDAVSWDSPNSLTLSAIRDINVNQSITNGGSGGVNLYANANDTGGSILLTGASITTNGGNVTLAGGYSGNGYAIGTVSNPHGVTLDGASISTGTGDIVIRGKGYNTSESGSGGYGISLLNSSSLITTGSGNITLTGYGGNYGGSSTGGSKSYGVYFDGSGTVTSDTGPITITGYGGNGTYGAGVYAGGAVTSTGGDITITGTGGDGKISEGYSYGVHVGGSVTSGGNISITGTGGSGVDAVGADGIGVAGGDAYGGNGDTGIYVDPAAIIAATGASSTITLDGTGGAGGTATGGNGDTGYSGGSGYGGNGGRGVEFYGLIDTSAGSGAITIIGRGGAGGNGIGGTGSTAGLGYGGEGGYGVYIGGTVSSVDGAISITGTGGSSTTGGWGGYGVYIDGSVTSTGTGNLTINGTGGSGYSDCSEGCWGNGGVYIGGTVASAAGTIDIIGYGGDGTAGTYSGDGVVVDSSGTVTSTGGAITIEGHGGNGINGQDAGYGVVVDGDVTSAGGNISILGFGGNGAFYGGDGVYIGGTVTSAGGDINITGTGGNGIAGGYGVYLESATIATGGGALNITGTGGGGDTGGYGIYTYGASLDSGAGAMTLFGTGGGGAEGLYFDSGTLIGGHWVPGEGGPVVSTPQYGDITLIADSSGPSSIAIVNNDGGVYFPIIQGYGTLTMQPFNPASTIGLAGGLGEFNLDSLALGAITGFSDIVIGHPSGTGFIDVGAIGWEVPGSANLTLRNPGSNSEGMHLGGTLTLVESSLTLNTTGVVTQASGRTESAIVTWQPFDDAGGTQTVGGMEITATSGYGGFTAADVAQVANGGAPINGLLITTPVGGWTVAPGVGNTSVFTSTSANANVGDISVSFSGGSANPTAVTTQGYVATAGIIAGGLELLGTGGYFLLTSSLNNVSTLAGNTGGVAFNNGNNNLNINTLNTTVGLNTTDFVAISSSGLTQNPAISATKMISINGEVTKCAGVSCWIGPDELGGSGDWNTAGNWFYGSVPGNTAAVRIITATAAPTINISSPTTVGSVVTNAALTQDAPIIAASSLLLLGHEVDYVLENADNSVGTLAGVTKSVSFTNHGAFIVGGLTAQDNDNITLNTTLSGAVTQTAPIRASGLELLGLGDYTLKNTHNQIGTLAGNVASVELVNNRTLTIGTLNTSGLTATGDITLTAKGLSEQDGIDVYSPLKSTGGNITLTGYGGNSSGGYAGYGVYIDNTVTASGTDTGKGHITINGYGGSDTGGGYGGNGVDIGSEGAVTTSGTGNISIAGYAGAGGYVSAGGDSAYGVYVGGLVKSTGTGDIIIAGTGSKGINGGNGGDGVYVGGLVESTGGGNISITGTGGNGSGDCGDGCTIGYGGDGVYVDGFYGDGTISTSGSYIGDVTAGNKGTISITGTGGYGGSFTQYLYDTSYGDSAHGGDGGQGVFLDSATISTAITVTGNVASSSKVGTINIEGTGGQGGNSVNGDGGLGGGGVRIFSSDVTTNTGTGSVASSSKVGTINITGTGGQGGNSSTDGSYSGDSYGGDGGYGVYIENIGGGGGAVAHSITTATTTGAVTNSTVGTITISGYGGDGGNSTFPSITANGGYGGYGIELIDEITANTVTGSVTASSVGDITLTGVGGKGGDAVGYDSSSSDGGNAYGGPGGTGIYIESAAYIATDGATSTIMLNGTGGDGGAATGGKGAVDGGYGGSGYGGYGGTGVEVYGQIDTPAGNGATNIVGNGGAGGSGTGGLDDNGGASGYGGDGGYGVYIDNTGLVTTSSAGAISINGVGGAGGARDSGDGGYGGGGVEIGGRVTSGTGGTTITGIGGNGGLYGGSGGDGVYIGNTVASGGAMSITGTGGDGITSGTGGDGVVIGYGSEVSSTGGNITLEGTTGAEGFYDISVESSLVSTGGNITLTGHGSDLRLFASYGASTISATGSGTVTGSGFNFLTVDGGDITSGAGNINLTAGEMDFLSNGRVQSTGSGQVNLTATGPNGIILGDSSYANNKGYIGSDTASGDITLTTDKLTVWNPIPAMPPDLHLWRIKTDGTLVIKSYSSGIPIDLGTDTSNLSLNSDALHTITAGILKVGDSSAGDITITAPIGSMSSGGTLSLQTGGYISGSSENTITVDNLALRAVGGINLTAPNSVTTLAANSTAGNIDFNNAGPLTIGTVNETSGLTATGYNITLNTAGSVTQTETAPISAAGLELLGAGANYTLTNAGNTVPTLAGNTGSINFTNSGDLKVGTVNSTAGLTTTGNITLNAAGSVTQTAPIVINNSEAGLALLGAGANYTLTNAGNAVPMLAGNTGSINFKNNGDLTVGTVNSTAGLTTSGDVSLISTNGIIVNNNISMGADRTLVLRADSDADGVGTVTFPTGSVTFPGSPGTAVANIFYNPSSYASPTVYSGYFTGGVTPTAFMLVNSVDNLQALNTNLAGAYALGKDIDASATSSWNSDGSGGFYGFAPIGNASTSFTGKLYGDNHTISGLFIDRPASYYVGLFGYTGATAAIKNVGLTNGNITGNIAVGGMVGMNYGTIANSYSTGAVSGTGNGIGGLVGYNYGAISNSYSTNEVSGSGISNLGGLVGYNGGGSSISNSYSTGAVSGTSTVGGLVGYNSGGTISNSYSTGAVSGTSTVGGLVGYHYSGAISNSYSTGAVPVTGNNIGGLVGLNYSGTTTSSYWDTVTSGRSTSAGGTGKTTSEMMTQATFVGWDFANTWWMSEGNTRPFLRSEYSTNIINAHQLQLMGMNATTLAASYSLANNIDMSELTKTSGLWNTSTGFLPVGTFTGTFDGLGRTISNLTINRPAENNIGMFSATSGLVKNIGLLGGSVTGGASVGGLAGINSGTISNSYNTGSVNATGQSNVGGLVGYNTGTVTDSHATGNVSSTGSSGGDGGVGGLVGTDYTGIVSNSYATGNVSSSALIRVGGLVGWQYYEGTGAISNSYATGDVSGVNYVGGLVGEVYGVSPISNSYATGNVSGTDLVGGLIGNIYYNGSGIVSTSYSTGLVTGTGSGVGGLVGQMQGSGGVVNASYWDTDTSGKIQGLGMNFGGTFNATGLTTIQMQTAANFDGFNFTTTPGAAGNNWIMVDADGTLNNAGAVLGATRPMLASEYSTDINNAHQLQLMSMNLGANYTLANNIDLSPEFATVGGKYTGMWGAEGFVPVGTLATAFTGTFDGLGRNITDLYINRPGTNYVGLFGYANSATIRNVGLVNGDIIGQSEVGGLVGRFEATGGGTATITNSSTSATVSGLNRIGGLVGVQFSSDDGSINTIENSHSTGAVTGNWDNYDAGIGGLAGFQEAWGGTSTITNSYHSGGLVKNLASGSTGGLVGFQGANGSTPTITNSYNTAEVTGTNWVGGLVGYNSGGSVNNNSYNAGTVSGTDYVGGLVGYNTKVAESGGDITNSYNTGTVSGSGHSVGGLVGGNAGTITYSNSTGMVSGANSVGGLVGGNSGTIDNSYSTGTVGGSGDSVGGLVGGNAGTITYSNSTGDVSGSGDSVGGLVGDNNAGAISNSFSTGMVSGANSVGGLVGWNYGGSISDSYSTGTVSSTGGWYIGGLVGNNESTAVTSTITSSHSTGDVTGSGNFVGGLVGRNYGGTISISDSHSTGAVSGNDYVGGLVGYNDMAGISNSYSTGTVTGNSEVGGLVGHTDGSITNAHSTGAVSGNSYVGGLAGYNFGTISDSYSTGAVSGNTHVGGLVGYNMSSITNSNATGTITGTGTDSFGIGGLVGYNSGAISNSSSSSNVSGDGSVGGLVGYMDADGTVDNSYSTGTITGGDYGPSGGLIGMSLGNVSNAYSTGSVNVVNGNGAPGGLVGLNEGTISNSYSTGDISGQDTVGGLVGQNSPTGSIANSYSTGAVTGTGGAIGGLVGMNEGAISNSYSTGTASGNSSVGGLVGFSNGGTITNSYWDMDTSGQTTSAGGTGKTTAEMMAQGTYPQSWDFTAAGPWRIVDTSSYPYLKWQFGGASPQIISGNLQDDNGVNIAGSGRVIQTAVDGSLLAKTTTGANGFYYLALSGNSVPDNGALLTYVSGDNDIKGALVYLSNGQHIAGQSIIDHMVKVNSSGGDISNATMNTAKGSLSSADIPYSVSGNDLTVNTGYAFETASGIGYNYNLNGNITSGGYQTYNRPLILSANATLTSGSTGGIAFNNIVTAGNNALTVYGGSSGIEINGALSTNSILSLTSSGPITQQAAITANTLNVTNTAAATDLSAAGNVISYLGTIDATGQVFSLNNTVALNQTGILRAGTLNLTNTAATDLSSQNNVISSLGNINATGQDFSLNNTRALDQTGLLTANTFTLTNTGAVTQSGSGAITAGTLNLTSTGGINLSGNNNVGSVHLANNTSGNVNYNSAVGIQNTLTIDGSNATPGGIFTATEATGNLNVNGGDGLGNITTQSGDVSLKATRVDGVLMITGNIDTGSGGNVTLTADNMYLSGVINAGAGSGKVVTLQPNANTTVQVGYGALDGPGQLGLTDLELQTVTADTLRVGKSTSGIMTVTGGATLTSAPKLKLISGAGISGSGNTITVSNLALSGGAGVVDVTTAAGTVAAQNTSGGITISNTQSTGLTVGAVDGLSGLSSNGGNISLTETMGDITIANTVNAGTGNVTLNAAGALVNGVTSSDKNVIANGLDATAGNGIGHQAALQTQVADLTAENTGGSNNINITNIGALNVSGGILNSGSGNIVLDNTGAIDTGSQKIQASQGGAVTVTAHSPLTVGSGGVTADGDVILEAANSGGNDTLTINGPVRSNNGNVNLTAGSAIVLNATVEAPHGTVTRTVHGALVIDSSGVSSQVLATELLQALVQSENTNTTALTNTYIVTVEEDNARTAPPPEKKEDEDKDSDKKGSTSQSEETSKAKLPYCN